MYFSNWEVGTSRRRVAIPLITASYRELMLWKPDYVFGDGGFESWMDSFVLFFNTGRCKSHLQCRRDHQ